MYGTGVRERESLDIDKQVEKIINGLGNPNPPVALADVRELLRLDPGYYSSKDDGLLRETISRLKVATKQFWYRPAILLEAIRKRDLKALYVPDGKRMLFQWPASSLGNGIGFFDSKRGTMQLVSRELHEQTFPHYGKALWHEITKPKWTT